MSCSIIQLPTFSYLILNCKQFTKLYILLTMMPLLEGHLTYKATISLSQRWLLIQVWLCWKYYIWSACKFKNNFHTSTLYIPNFKYQFPIKKKQVQILSKMKQKNPIIFKIFVLRYNILAINLMKLFKNKKM
jgi:hypothetical protein